MIIFLLFDKNLDVYYRDNYFIVIWWEKPISAFPTVVHHQEVGMLFHRLLERGLAGVDGKGNGMHLALRRSHHQGIKRPIDSLKGGNFQIRIKIGDKFTTFHSLSIKS